MHDLCTDFSDYINLSFLKGKSHTVFLSFSPNIFEEFAEDVEKISINTHK